VKTEEKKKKNNIHAHTHTHVFYFLIDKRTRLRPIFISFNGKIKSHDHT